MHEGAILLVELGAVVLGLGLLGRLAGRFGLSPIPLYLLAGLAFGDGGILPLVTAQGFIEVGADIGVVLLLLLLGLEYSARELIGSLRTTATAGIVDLVLNFGPGFLAGFVLDYGPLAATALGGVTYVSSSGVVAKLLSDLGRYGNRETPMVLSIVVFEDLAMAAYLPVLGVLLAGAGLATSLLPMTLAVMLVVAVLLFALRFGPLLSRLMFTPNDEVLLLKVVGLALLVAGVAEEAGASEAVGAFLVGIALSGPAADGARSLLRPLRDLFAAVFFVFFGLQTDPAAIPPVALPAALLALAGIVTKVATGIWAARRDGVGTPGQWRAGTVLVARGEFSIVIAGLAASASLGSPVAALAAAYVIILAVAGPVLTRIAEPPWR